MNQEQKEEISQREYGKSYDKLSTNEQRAVGGLFRRDQMGSEGYKDMSKTEYSGKEERESAKQDE